MGKVQLTLEEQDLDYIGRVLFQRPYGEVVRLIAVIQGQVQGQGQGGPQAGPEAANDPGGVLPPRPNGAAQPEPF